MSKKEYDHKRSTRKTLPHERPVLPLLEPEDFVKGKYSYGDKRCFTARMMDVFLVESNPYVAAYKEFRLAVMDYLYENHRDDHAATAEDRCKCWNEVGLSLGYELINKANLPWAIAMNTESQRER